MIPPEFLPDDDPRQTSHGRFKYRITRWKNRKAKAWWLRHTFWWLVHNCFAHILIGFVPIKLFFRFHDWTSERLAGKHLI